MLLIIYATIHAHFFGGGIRWIFSRKSLRKTLGMVAHRFMPKYNYMKLFN